MPDDAWALSADDIGMLQIEVGVLVTEQTVESVVEEVVEAAPVDDTPPDRIRMPEFAERHVVHLQKDQFVEFIVPLVAKIRFTRLGGGNYEIAIGPPVVEERRIVVVPDSPRLVVPG